MELKTALEELANDIYQSVKERIERYGVNQRTGTNTLIGSELEKSLNVTSSENGIVLSINPYWEFISRGWKRTGNYNGTFAQFVNNVSDWVSRKGIRFGDMTQNQITWAVVMNIWNKGIAARPFLIYDDNGDLYKMLPELEFILNGWANEVFNNLINEIKYFK